MNKSIFRFTNVWLWTIFFFLILIAVNLTLFHSYQQLDANKDLNGWVVFWNYCAQDSFKTVSISLLIPIILAAIGGIFKIDNTIEERIRNSGDERTKKRWECVTETMKMWDALFSLTNEVRYFYDTGEEAKKRMVAILKEVENLTNIAGNIIYTWQYRLPNLSPQKLYMILRFANILYDTLASVSDSILRCCGNKEKEGEIKILRDSLGVTQDCVQAIGHYPILDILKKSVEYLADNTSNKEKKVLEKEINNKLLEIEKVLSMVVQIDMEVNEVFPGIDLKRLNTKDKNKVLSFRDGVKQYGNWLLRQDTNTANKRNIIQMMKSKQDNLNKHDTISLPDLGTLPYEKFVDTWNIEYSKEYIKRLNIELGKIVIEGKIKGKVDLIRRQYISDYHPFMI